MNVLSEAIYRGLLLALLIYSGSEVPAMGLPVDVSGGGQWRAWQSTNFLLLDTPEKAIDFAEAAVRAAFGPAQVNDERPFEATDLGTAWRVRGRRLGSHALGLVPTYSTVTLDKKTGAILDFRLTGASIFPEGNPALEAKP